MSLRVWRLAFALAVRLGLAEPLLTWIEDRYFWATLRRPVRQFPWWTWSDRGARA